MSKIDTSVKHPALKEVVEICLKTSEQLSNGKIGPRQATAQAELGTVIVRAVEVDLTIGHK